VNGVAKRLSLWSLPAVLAFGLSAGSAAQPYDFGNPSPDEEWMRQLMNRARLDGEAEADRLGLVNDHVEDDPDGAYDVGEGITLSGVTDQRDYWSRYQGPRQPLAWSASLNAAALNHSDDMHTFNFFDHYTEQSSHGYTGGGYPDGDRPSDRAYQEGYVNHFVFENIAVGTPAGWYSAADMHVGFFNDLGPPPYPGRGHRKNILHSFLREVGIGYVSRDPNAGGWCDYWTIDLASDAFAAAGYDDPSPVTDTVYVTGVVFDDDGDGAYEVGEEMPGVRVYVYQAGGPLLKHYADTAAGGGYSVPLLAADGSDVAEGAALRVVFFDPAGKRYLTADRTLQAGDVTMEEDNQEVARTYHQRFNVLADALAADFQAVNMGDANFDGTVNYLDVGVLATNYNTTGKDWTGADFTGDGAVSYLDLGILSTNYGAGAGGQACPLYGAEAGGGAEAPPVPEPAALAMLLAAVAAGLTARRGGGRRAGRPQPPKRLSS